MLFPLRKRRKSSRRRKRTRNEESPQVRTADDPMWECAVTGICKVNSRLYTKTVRFNDINYQLAQNGDRHQSLRIGVTSSTTSTALSLFSSPSSTRERTSMSLRSRSIFLSRMMSSTTSELVFPVCYGNSSPKETMACSSASTLPSGLRLTRCILRSQTRKN